MSTRTIIPSYHLYQLTGSSASRFELNVRNQVAFTEFIEGGRLAGKFFDGNTIHDIGGLGGRVTIAQALNNAGEVTGSSHIDAESGTFHAFFWSRQTGMINLGKLNGAAHSFGIDINNRGEVAGTLGFDGDPSALPFIWSRQNGMESLGTVNGQPGVAVEINNMGRIMGQASGQEAIFSWTRGEGMIVISPPGGGNILANDLNSPGQIVGRFTNFSGSQGFLWTPGEGLLTLGTEASDAIAINDEEVVVGVLASNQHAFSWTRAEGFRDLGSLGGFSFPQDVNNRNRVVGHSQLPDFSTHGFLWTQEDGMLDLNSLVSNAPTGMVLTSGQQINDNDIIVAEGGGGLFLLLPGAGSMEPPVVGAIAMSGEIDINQPLTFSANFSDVDLAQTHTATWDWGDGNQEAGTVTESNGRGTVTGTHSYLAQGLYTVTLTVIDSGGMRTTVRRSVGIGVPF
jgi:probable HAF family extracellular repeat protein